MKRKGNQGWRYALGMLAVGMLAFGLSLRGAPAEDQTAGTADGVKKRSSSPGAASPRTSDTTPKVVSPRDVAVATATADPVDKLRPGVLRTKKPRVPVSMRVKSMTGYAPSPSPAGRSGGVQVGDPCSCDSDCANLDSDGGCQLGQCIRVTEASGVPNIDGACQIIQQIASVRCEADGDPCTVGRCGGGGTCNDGPGRSSPCAKECTGPGDDAGQNCCDEPTGCYSCTSPNTCENKPRVTCVNDGGRPNCQVDGSDDQFGRCCDPANVLAGQYTTLADCQTKDWQWLEITDPDDEMHLPVRCPAYSSGIIFGKPTDDASAVYPIVPPPRQCSMKNDDSNYGAYCEIDADCAHRCQNDNDIVCTVNSDCDAVGGLCVPDICVDVVGPGRCPGPYAIGDDFLIKIPAGRALRLQEIRFRGGGERQLEVITFDFYDKSSGSPVRTGTVRMRVAQAGIYTYTIERDCDPNCDASQFCNPPTNSCECLPRDDGCIADPPFIVPADGYMVMRSGRSIDRVLDQDDLNGSWAPVVDPVPNKGFNDPDVMWVDDGPIGAADAGPLPAGQRVLAFELVGILIDDPEGACCDPYTGNCTDTNQWECRFCSGTGANAGDVCDRGGANWSGIDRDCAEEGEECVTQNWRGPRTKSDYDEPWCHGGNDDGLSCDKETNTCDTGLCYGGEKCVPDDPCSDGTCCDAEGHCSAGGPGDCLGNHCLKDPTMGCETDPDCELGPNDFGPCLPLFQGFGTLCDPDDPDEPNCCPQPVDAWGECCRDEYRCTGGLELPCDPADPTACDNGNDGSCELVCPGPIIFDIPVPPLVPPGQATVVDLTTDSRRAEFNAADTCAYQSNDGWYASFHVSECARVTFNYCCTDPMLGLVSRILVKGCPCDGPVAYIPPDPGRSGYGDACGNEHCCEDGNYSVQWTIRAGTYHYGVPAGTYCEQSGDVCTQSLDCAPGEACKDFSQALQAHIIVEPCFPAACCNGATCSWLPKFECEDGGGDWLGDLLPNPVVTCKFGACDQGACCTPDGSCEDFNGDGISPEACAALAGDYHGGVRCADRPCTVCEFNMIGSQIDNNHCQGDTGQYLFPSDRYQGTRRADDFRPQDSPIRRICFGFGFVTEGTGPECANHPPREDFEIHIYEDTFGFPDTEIAGSPGPVDVDHAEPMPGMRSWQFSAPVGGAGGVEVDPGECYWLEITGMGTDSCSTLWTHSVDGNNYGLRDDNMDYTAADIRDNDVVWCIDTGIVVPSNLGTNGGCGDVPVACCHRGARGSTCDQRTFNECSDVGSFGFPYSVCGTFECPVPDNDLCTSDPSGVGPPDTAAVVCSGDPKHPERGEWRVWTGELGDRLGQCDDWPGEAGYGQVCNPQTQDCREPPTASCMPYPGEAYECWFDGDNRLASTDGPVAGGACGDYNAMQADVWHRITAPCRGRAVVTMCDGEWEYDGMLSVYGDDTPDLQCPTLPDGNDDLLECNDEYCRGSFTVAGVHWDAVEGAVYLLRQGGWSANGGLTDAAQGKAQFHVGFFCNPVIPYQPLQLPPNPVHHVPKHRYISVDATTNGPEPVAIKVEIADMRRCAQDLTRSCLQDGDCSEACDNDLCRFCTADAQCDGGSCVATGPCVQHPSVGLSWFVQQPQTRGANCPNGMCDEEDYYARLGPDLYVSDWKDECEDGTHIPGWTGGCSTLHIGDCEIVPNVTYNVYACDPVTGDPCSAPLQVPTQVMPVLSPRDYGDVAGAVDGGTLEFTPPDGYVNAFDIDAYMLTNLNWGTPNRPQAHPTWVDLHGDGIGIPPQYVLNVVDLALIWCSFNGGVPWMNIYGGLDPDNCDTGAGAGTCPCPGPGPPMPPGLPPDEEHRARKHRYLSIDATTNYPNQVAWKVELVEYKRCQGDLEEACAVDLDCTTPADVYYGPCVNTHPAVGLTWWVQEPQEVVVGCRKRCHTHDGAFCDADTECIPPEKGSCIQRCGATDQFARLEANAIPPNLPNPYFSDWTDPRFPLTTLHIGDCEVVPVATYEIRACAPPDGAVCGEPLVIGTIRQAQHGVSSQANFGDLAGRRPDNVQPYPPPNGVTNVEDMQALKLTLAHWPAKNTPQIHVTWADLSGDGVTIGNPPQYIPNVSDLGVLLQALSPNETWRGAHGHNRNPNDCPQPGDR